MKLKGYQEAKIKELVDKTIEQLDIDGMRRKRYCDNFQAFAKKN